MLGAFSPYNSSYMVHAEYVPTCTHRNWQNDRSIHNTWQYFYASKYWYFNGWKELGLILGIIWDNISYGIHSPINNYNVCGNKLYQHININGVNTAYIYRIIPWKFWGRKVLQFLHFCMPAKLFCMKIQDGTIQIWI